MGSSTDRSIAALLHGLVGLGYFFRHLIQSLQSLDDIRPPQESSGQVAGELAPHFGTHAQLRFDEGLRLLSNQYQTMFIDELAEEFPWKRIGVGDR